MKRQHLAFSTRLSVSLLLLAGGLAGCERDEAEAHIQSTASTLTLLDAGRGVPPEPDFARQSYSKIKSELGSLGDHASDMQRGAAGMILAETQIGQAVQAEADAIAAERDALDRIIAAQAQFSLWRQADSIADNAEAYDAAPVLESLQQELDQADAALRDLVSTRAGHASEAADLQSRIDELLTQAQTERSQAARLDLDAARLSAREALNVYRQSQDHARSADRLALRAEQIQIDLDQVTPRVEQADLEREHWTRRRETVLNQIKTVTNQRDAKLENARAARRNASQLRDELREMVFGADGLTQFRTQTLDPAVDAAVNAYESTRSHVRPAQTVLRTQAQLISARIDQGRAGVLADHAGGIVAYRELLSRLDGIGMQDAAAALTKARQKEISTRRSAAEAYRAAVAALESAGVRDQAAQDALAGARSSLASAASAQDDALSDLGVTSESPEEFDEDLQEG
ncbi:MAG: hypothetical protein H6811_04720 [Phycisphaeraceae bacterium]|nr:hypothetical protein [Phycisphaeraceae bacterium]